MNDNIRHYYYKHIEDGDDVFLSDVHDLTDFIMYLEARYPDEQVKQIVEDDLIDADFRPREPLQDGQYYTTAKRPESRGK